MLVSRSADQGPGAIRGLFHPGRKRGGAYSRNRIPLLFGLFSAISHLVVMEAADLGSFHLAAPVFNDSFVELVSPAPVPVQKNLPRAEPEKAQTTSVKNPVLPENGESLSQSASVEVVKELKEGMDMSQQGVADVSQGNIPFSLPSDDAGEGSAVSIRMGEGPVRQPSEFMAAVREKLSYRLSMYGIPVGSGELQAMNEGNELRIRWNVRSNNYFSVVYPVSNSAETRIVGGNYIIASIMQEEGDFVSDTGFTLCLREKKGVWVDRRKNLVYTHPLESSRAVDVLSGLYLIRNKPLIPGETLWIDVFDNNREVRTPVEVLRNERVDLPGLRQADTVVIRPLLQTDGLFRRSGELLLWLTDDEKRVPVKMETAIPAGTVTAELVSAEVVFPQRTP